MTTAPFLRIAMLVTASFTTACFARSQSLEELEFERSRRAHLESLRPWAGCFALLASPWQSTSGRVDTGSLDAPRVTLPSEIRLDVKEHLGYLLMTPAPDSATGYGNAAWLALGTDPQRDTLVLIWLMNSPRPFRPILWGPLTLNDGRYRGRLTVRTDLVGRELPYRDLEAIRQPCSG